MSEAQPRDVLPSAASFRKLLLVALLAETGISAINLSTMPVYLFHDRKFGEALIGLVVVTYLLTESLMKGPFAALAQRIGRRPLILAGCLVPALTVPATLLLPRDGSNATLAAIFLLRALDGIGAAMLWPPLIVEIAQSVKREQRSVAIATANSCYLIGIGLALPLGGVANEVLGSLFKHSVGARSPGLMAGAAMCIIAGLFAATMLSSRRDSSGVPEEKVSLMRDAGHVLKQYPLVALVAALIYMVIGFPMPTLKLLAEQQFAISEATFGVLAIPVMAVMGALSVFMSRLSRHTPVYKSLSFGLLIIAFGLVPLALAVLIPGFRAIWSIMLGGAPLALGFLLVYPAWTTYVHDLDPERSTVNVGTIMAVQGIGAMVGAALGGFSYQYGQALIGVEAGRFMPFVGACVAAILAYFVTTGLPKTARIAKSSTDSVKVGTTEVTSEGETNAQRELPY